ncbi:MAG: cell surface protein, partial [Muribaculaceae bacterium]|nr:cell surface protein [Muribaculaceae bacterium]
MNKKTLIYIGLLSLVSCSSEIPMVNLGIDDIYYIPRMSKLPLQSALTGERYLWRINGEPVSTERSYIFLAQEEGTYNLTFEIIDEQTPYHFDFTVNVLHEEVEYSPYISRVYEYCPAPGQFVNEMPRYEEGDTYADILKKAEESISGTNDIM